MKRVVVRVHLYGVCVVVCEIPPHFTWHGTSEACGQRAFNVTVLSCKKCDASFLHNVSEMFVQELFTFVGSDVQGSPLLYHRFEGFCHVFSLLRLMFGVGIDGLEGIFYMSESSLFEIVFPQFRSTGETSRVSDASEMLDGIFFKSL